MRIVELLNEGVDIEPPHPSDAGGYEYGDQEELEKGDVRAQKERQRAFEELLVTGASSRFFLLTGPVKGATKGLQDPLSAASSWGKGGGKAAAGEKEENPLYLLLRATQETVEKDKQRKQQEEEEKAKTKQQKEEQGDEQERGLRQRRAKQRVVFRRCYYKKINTLTALRSEHGELQAAFTELLARYSARRRRSPVDREEVMDSICDRYIALVVEKEMLRRQRGQLADATTAQAKTRDTLQWLVDAELKAIARDDAAADATETLTPFPAAFLDVPPMSKAEAVALASEMHAFMVQCSQDDLERLNGDKDESCRASESVLGWETQCSTGKDAGVGSYRVWSSRKRVEADKTPLELCRRSLEVLTISRRHGDAKRELRGDNLALLAPWAGADVTIAQMVDADHVLIHVGGQSASDGGLYLCSCESLPTDGGEGCTLTIQPVEWAAANDSDKTASMGRFRSATSNATRCWISVDQQRNKRRRSDCGTSGAPRDVSIHYAVPQAGETSERSLVIDVARASCQWEAQVVGALFDLSSPSAPSSSPPAA